MCLQCDSPESLPFTTTRGKASSVLLRSTAMSCIGRDQRFQLLLSQIWNKLSCFQPLLYEVISCSQIQGRPFFHNLNSSWFPPIPYRWLNFLKSNLSLFIHLLYSLRKYTVSSPILLPFKNQFTVILRTLREQDNYICSVYH